MPQPGDIISDGRNVSIFAPTAVAFFDAKVRADAFLFDPDRPHVGPNQLLKEMGNMIDPRQMSHHCPFCDKTMSWELFGAHMKRSKEGPGCFQRWFNTMDVTHRKFSGASIGDASE